MILKVVSESSVTLAISVPILVFLGLSVLDLGPMYATDSRQTDVRRTDVFRRQTKSSLNAPPIRGGGITMWGRQQAVPLKRVCERSSIEVQGPWLGSSSLKGLK